jgi:hypothetical protein
LARLPSAIAGAASSAAASCGRSVSQSPAGRRGRLREGDGGERDERARRERDATSRRHEISFEMRKIGQPTAMEPVARRDGSPHDGDRRTRE